MKNIQIKKGISFTIILLFIGMSIISSTGREVKNIDNLASLDYFSENEDTEYWGLIFAVGVYKNNPWQDRPSMLECADNLYEVLIDSPQWKADHIHKVTAENSTGRRLIQELIWLIQSEDKNDMSLIYLTTHGSPLKTPIIGIPIDLPPRDEDDRADEILVMYEGFDKRYAFIWDDLLNFFLSLLQSKGVCLIVDSCYAGGFNDNPMFPRTIFREYTSESFSKGLAEELSSQNRIVLMACEEDEPSYGCHFSEFLIEGFWGKADLWGNKDGINSAEEGFDYSKFWVSESYSFTPTILDQYSGEYPVTFS